MKPEEALERVEGLKVDAVVDPDDVSALRIVLAMAKAAQGMAKALDSLVGAPGALVAAEMPPRARSRINCVAEDITEATCALAEFRKASGGDAP